MHDNKVTTNFGVNQFQSKRYPDEDAVNPFEGQGGQGGELWTKQAKNKQLLAVG